MEQTQIRFISQNKFKIAECKEILCSFDINVVSVTKKIEELQTQDTDWFVRNKIVRAFDEIRRPLFVEHTGLYLKCLNGFPGGLTQIFWDSLQADKFSELFGNTPVIAKTVIGYTNGRTIQFFTGEVSGTVADQPRGNRDFQWDCIFIPDNYTKTFSELGKEKNKISMRRQALGQLAKCLQTRGETT
jgi:XTP/dITP diphosphohydrolase